ncbi:serine/threonine protein kinase [Plasmodium fragile]|uniref:Serine/threonine protein kinase n=1 Tax=Plasmodium fragile TaxID=5857 RepID=A0A0D9QJX7_PLAFR|nr:serine/threonine protein kinase [Plasmodium fragile]KJP87253.1 serine/threonine protein kinase [Plasmodium fragile]
MNDMHMQQYYMDKIKKNISQIKKSKNINLPQNVHEGNFNLSENYHTNHIDGQQHRCNGRNDILFSENRDHVRICYDNNLRRNQEVPWGKAPIHSEYNVTGDTNFYDNYVMDYNNEMYTNDHPYESYGCSNGQTGYVDENVIWDEKLKQYKPTHVTSPSFVYTPNNIAVQNGSDIHGGIIDTQCFYNSCVNKTKLISNGEVKKVASSVSAPYETSEPHNRGKLHIVSNSLCTNNHHLNTFFDEHMCNSSSIPFSNCVRNVSSTSCYERGGSTKCGVTQKDYDTYGHLHQSGHIVYTNCSNHILGGNRRNYTGNLPNNVMMNVDCSGHSCAGRGIFRDASLGSCIRRDALNKGMVTGGEIKTAVCCLAGISNSDRRKQPTPNSDESLKNVVRSQGSKIHVGFPRHKDVVKEWLKNPIELIYKKPRVNSNRAHCAEVGRVHSGVASQERSDLLRQKKVSNPSIDDNDGNVLGVNSHRCLGGCFAKKELPFMSNKKSISSTRLQEPHVFYPKKVSSLNANAGCRNNQCVGGRQDSAIAPNVLCLGMLGKTPQTAASHNGASQNNVLEHNEHFMSSFRTVDQSQDDRGDRKSIEKKDNHIVCSQQGKRSCLNFPLQGISVCMSKRGCSQNEPYEGGNVGKHKLDIVHNAPKQDDISYVEESNLDPMNRHILKGDDSLCDTSFSTLGTKNDSDNRLNMKLMDNHFPPPCVNCINKSDLTLGEMKYVQAEKPTTVLYKESNGRAVDKVCNINGMSELGVEIKSAPLVEETNKGKVPQTPPTAEVHMTPVQNVEANCTDYEDEHDGMENKKTMYDDKVTNEQDTLLENSKYDEAANVGEKHQGTYEGSNFNYIEDDGIKGEEKKKLEKKLHQYFRKEGFLRPSSNSLPHDSEKGGKIEQHEGDEPGKKSEKQKRDQPSENDLTSFLKRVRNNSALHPSNRKSSITEDSQMENYDISSSSVDIFDDKEIKEVFEEVTINRSVKSSFCISRDEHEGPRKVSMELARDCREGEIIHDSASAKGKRKRRGKRSLPSLEHLFCKNKNLLFIELLRSMKGKEEEKKKGKKKENALESKLNQIMLPTSEKERNLIDKIIYCLDPSYVNDTVDEADKWRQKLTYMRDKFVECILCVSYPIHLWNEETFEGYLKSLNLNALFDDTFIKYESDLHIDLFHLEEELFSDVGNIGEGGFGVVTKMRFLSNPQYYAIKKISKEHIIKSQAAGQTYLEAKYHSVLSHVNIIKMYGCMQDNDFIYHVLEYCAKGSIYSISKNFKRRIIPDELAYKYFCHVVNGLYYLNQMGIFHRDIKMENVLVDHMDNAKLSDFGLSAMILGTRSHSALCGTLVYFSPEITSGSGYDWRSDIWSLGVLLYEMLVGDVPFDGTKTQIINSIFSCNLKFPDFVNPLAINLIKKALVVDVNKRIKLCDISSDPWMQEMWKLSFQKGLIGNADSCYSRKDDSGDFNFIGSLLKAQCFSKSSLNASLSYPIRGREGDKKQMKLSREDVLADAENDNVDALILETQQKLAEYLKVENFYVNEENVPSSDGMSSHQSEASFSQISDSSGGAKQEVAVGGDSPDADQSAECDVRTSKDLSGNVQEGSRTSVLSGAPHEDQSVTNEPQCSSESTPLEGITQGSVYPKATSSSCGSIMENGDSSSYDDPCLKGLNWKTQSNQSNAAEEAELVYSSESVRSNTNQCDDVSSAPCVEKKCSEDERDRDYLDEGATPKMTDDAVSENTIPDRPHNDANLYDNSSVSNMLPCSSSSQRYDRLSSEVEEIVPEVVDIESLEKLVQRKVDNGRRCPRAVLPIHKGKCKNRESNDVEEDSIICARGEAKKALLDGGKKKGENKKGEHSPSTRGNIQPSHKSEKGIKVDETYIPICVIKEKATESSGESNGTKINLHMKDTIVGKSSKSFVGDKRSKVDAGEARVVKTPSIQLSGDKMEYAKRSRIEKGQDKNSKANKLCKDTTKEEVAKKGTTQFRSTSEMKKRFAAKKREDTVMNKKVENMLEKTCTGKLYKKDSLTKRSGTTNARKNPLVKGKDKEQTEKEKRRSRSCLCDVDGTSLYDEYIERINKLYLSIKNKKYLNDRESRKSTSSEENQASAATGSLQKENKQGDVRNDELVEDSYAHDNEGSVEGEESSSTLMKRKNKNVSSHQDKQKEERKENEPVKTRSFHLSSYAVETASSTLVGKNRNNIMKAEKNAIPRGHGDRQLDEKSLDDKLANIEKEVSVMGRGKEKNRSSYKSRKEKSFLELKREIMNENVPNISERVTPDFFTPEGNAFNSSSTDGEEKSVCIDGERGVSGEGTALGGGSRQNEGDAQQGGKKPAWYYEKKNTLSPSNSDFASDKCFYRRYKQNRTIHLDTSQLVKRDQGSFKLVQGDTMDSYTDEQRVDSTADAEFVQCSEFSGKTHHAERSGPRKIITHPDGERKYVHNDNVKYQRAKSTSKAVQKGTKELCNLELISQIRQKNKVNLLHKVKKEVKCASNLGTRKVEGMVSSGSLNRSLSEVRVTSESVCASTYTGRSDLLKKGSSKMVKGRDVSQNSGSIGKGANSKSGVQNPSRGNNSVRNNSIEKQNSLKKEVLRNVGNGVKPTGTPTKRAQGKSDSSVTSSAQRLDSINSISSKSGENKKNMIKVTNSRLNSSSTLLSKSREDVDSSVEKRKRLCDDKTDRGANKGVSPRGTVKNPCLKKLTEGKVGGLASCYLKKGENSSRRRNGSENLSSGQKDKSKGIAPNRFVQNGKLSRTQQQTTKLMNREASDVEAANLVEKIEEQGGSLTPDRTENGTYPMHNGKRMILGNNLQNAKVKQYLKSKIEKVKKENEYASSLEVKTEESLGRRQRSHTQEESREETISHCPTDQYDSFGRCTNWSATDGRKFSLCTNNEVRRSISEIPFNCCVKHYFQSESNVGIKTGESAPKGTSSGSQYAEVPTWKIGNLCQRKEESGHSPCRSGVVGKYNWTTCLGGDLLHIDRVRSEANEGEAQKKEELAKDNKGEQYVDGAMVNRSTNMSSSRNVQQPAVGGARRQKTSSRIYSHCDINLSHVKSKIDTNIYKKQKSETVNVNSSERSGSYIESDECGGKGSRVLKGKENMSTYQSSSALSMGNRERKKKSLMGHPELGARNVGELQRLNSVKTDTHASNSKKNCSAKGGEHPYLNDGGPIKKSDSALFNTDYEEELQNKLLLLNKRSLCGRIDHRTQSYAKEGMNSCSKEGGNRFIYEGATNNDRHGQGGHSLHSDSYNRIDSVNGGSSERDRSCNWGVSMPICASSSNGKNGQGGEFMRMKSNCRGDIDPSEVNCLNGTGMLASGWDKCQMVRHSPVGKKASNMLLTEPAKRYCMQMEKNVKGNHYSGSFDEHDMNAIGEHIMENTSFNKLGSIVFSSDADECVEGSFAGKGKWVTPPPKGIVVTRKESLQEWCAPLGRSASRVGDNYPKKEAPKRNIRCGDWSIMQCVNVRRTDSESTDIADVDRNVPCRRGRNQVAKLDRDNTHMDGYVKGQNKGKIRDGTKGGQPVYMLRVQKSAQEGAGNRFDLGNCLLSRPSTPTSLHKRGEEIGRSDQQVKGEVMNKNGSIMYRTKPALSQQGSIKKSTSNCGSATLLNSNDKRSLTPQMGSTRVASSANCFTNKVVVDENESGWYTAICDKGGFFNNPNKGAKSKEGLLAKAASNCVHMDAMRRNNSAQVLPPCVVHPADNSASGCFPYNNYVHKEQLRSGNGDSPPGGVKGMYEPVQLKNRSMGTCHQGNGSAMSIKRMGSKTSVEKKGTYESYAKGADVVN